jgi:tetratricopeptide (TPR) repeat protein
MQNHRFPSLEGGFLSVFFRRAAVCGLLAAGLCASGVRAQDKASAFPPELEADLSAGTTAIYHLEFTEAREHLERAIQTRPDHPAAHFFITMMKWYMLTYDSLLRKDAVLERQIEKQADRTIDVAKDYVKRPGHEPVGFLYYGGGLGTKGWYYVSRGQFVKAYFSGKKGYNYLRRIPEIDPELYDAYLGIGMYEYYAATLGPVLKVLSAFLVSGNKEEALRSLELAQARSRYVRMEAAYFLWNAFLEDGKFDQAMEKVRFLNRSVPGSPLFNWSEIQTLFYQKKWEAVLQKGDEYISKSHAPAGVTEHPSRTNPYTLLLAKVYYHCGAAALNLKKPELARVYFEKAAAQPSEFSGWNALSELRLGEFEDLAGRRDQAVAHYRKASEGGKIWDLNRQAKDRRNRPFTEKDFAARTVLHSPLEDWKQEID